MANLYEIDKQIEACVDEETGEIVDLDRLSELMIERDNKIESVALWIKNLNDDIEGFKREEEAFATRRKQAEKKVESLKNWLGNALNGDKFATDKCVVSFRKSESVEVVDETMIPKKFMVEKITFTPNKTEIKKQLKAGNAIGGCTLVAKLNTQIK